MSHEREPPRSPEPGTTSVVVVAHDSGALLARCIAAVLAQDVAVEVIVVDNASHDGSIEALGADPRLHVLRNPDNPGFGRACNQGAADTRAPWLAFVNPDCLVEADSLARMRAHAHAAAGFAEAGPRDLRECFEVAMRGNGGDALVGGAGLGHASETLVQCRQETVYMNGASGCSRSAATELVPRGSCIRNLWRSESEQQTTYQSGHGSHSGHGNGRLLNRSRHRGRARGGGQRLR